MEQKIISRPYKSESLARKQLEYFIHHFDYRRDTMPKSIDPAHVETYVRQILEKGLPGVGPTRRIVELADFYRTRALASDFISLLTRKERTEEEYLISLSLAEAVAYIGDGSQRVLGRSYFHYLLNHRWAEGHMNALVECYAAYAQEDQGVGIKSRMEEIIAELKIRSESNPMAGVELRSLQDIRNNILPRIAKAAEYQRQISNLDSKPEMLDRLVAVYLNLDARYREYMERWAIRELLVKWEKGETGKIVEAFRRALEKIDSGSFSEEAKASLRGSALRAIEFFGGRLTSREKDEAKAIPPNLAGILTLEN